MEISEYVVVINRGALIGDRTWFEEKTSCLRYPLEILDAQRIYGRDSCER